MFFVSTFLDCYNFMRERQNFVAKRALKSKNFVTKGLTLSEKIVASNIENCKNFVTEPLIIGPRYGKILVKARIRRSVYAVSKGL